jgi:hypothetical protein
MEHLVYSIPECATGWVQLGNDSKRPLLPSPLFRHAECLPAPDLAM